MTTAMDTNTQTAIQNNHPEVLRLIIFGEVGVGKSKLICQLYNKTSDKDKLRIWRLFFDDDRYPDPPESSSTREAVTQNAKIYPTKINDKDALLVDTPGLGAVADDSYRILCGIEVMVELIGAFDAVLYATKTTDRDRMGGKVMVEILKDVFEQKDETKNLSDSVIIVGTHKDQAISAIGDNIHDDIDDDEYDRLVANYMSGKSKEILTELSKKWQDGGADGLQHIAFVTSVSNRRQNVEVDVDELNTKIISLCEGNKLTYSHPTPKQMAQLLRRCGW
jgi:GTPase SAR1 family protein